MLIVSLCLNLGLYGYLLQLGVGVGHPGKSCGLRAVWKMFHAVWIDVSSLILSLALDLLLTY